MCVCCVHYHLIVSSNFNTLDVPDSNPSYFFGFLFVCLIFVNKIKSILMQYTIYNQEHLKNNL